MESAFAAGVAAGFGTRFLVVRIISDMDLFARDRSGAVRGAGIAGLLIGIPRHPSLADEVDGERLAERDLARQFVLRQALAAVRDQLLPAHHVPGSHDDERFDDRNLAAVVGGGNDAVGDARQFLDDVLNLDGIDETDQWAGRRPSAARLLRR
jgi:hypothetical protein